MNKNDFYWNTQRISWLYVFHTAGTIALIIGLAIFMGCIKKEELEIVDGPAADSQAVAEAENEALEDHNLLDASVGDFVVYEITAQPFNAQPQFLNYMTGQVMEKNEKGIYFELAILRRKITPQDVGPDEVVESMDRCKVYKDTGETTCLPANYEPSGLAVATLAGQNVREFENKISAQNKEVSVHNFTSRIFIQDPPAVVKGSVNCGDTPNCALRTTAVEYDVIVRENGNRQRFRIQREFTADTPSLGIERKFCQSSNQQINGRLIPVVVCYTLANYKFGAKVEAKLEDIKSTIAAANNNRKITDAVASQKTLRILASKSGSNAYKIETLEFHVSSVNNPDVMGHSILSDAANKIIREGNLNCNDSSTNEDCSGYPLLDPALIPNTNGSTKFFNLSTIQYSTELPEAVRTRRGCTDPKSCPMTATLVRFLRQDIINNVMLRTVHSLEIAPEVPVMNSTSFRCSRLFIGAWPDLTSTRNCAILTDFLP